ncbi:uncharacterized protein LOC121427867 [Lytechinus variegatus]|uniref:uncharacterized protein LOC121427867 n=1 Tax=Lytechinus variegatus TaxID=7654 RepID=UPI001BB1723D|nr:uncharacterized protein LOC121427867 [Lytechinus variegatus]
MKFQRCIGLFLLLVAVVKSQGKKRASAMTDVTYDTIVKLIEGSFNVACAQRTTEEKSAITRYNRYRGRFSLQGDPPKLYLDEEMVLKKSQIPDIVMEEYFKANGAGARRIYHRLKRKFSGISEEVVRNILSQCSTHRRMNVTFTNKAPYIPITAKHVMERIQIDLLKMRTAATYKKRTYRYILTAIDVFSRYTWLRPMETKSSTNVARHLSKIFDMFGTPTYIQHDQGTEFKGRVKIMLSRRGIQDLTSAPYHPKSQGKVERSHRSKILFDLISRRYGVNWVPKLSKCAKVLNDEPKEVLGWNTPFSVFFGRCSDSSCSRLVDITADTLSYPNQRERVTIPRREHVEKYYIVITRESCIEQLFEDSGLTVRLNPKGNGNCQFSAVSDQLATLGIFRSHSTIREEVIRFLASNTYLGNGREWTAFLTEVPEDYLARMSSNGSYGDHLTLQAIADIFHIQILVISSLNGGTTLISPEINEGNIFTLDVPYIVLGHLSEGNGEHYVSLTSNQEQVLRIIRNSAQIVFEGDMTPHVEGQQLIDEDTDGRVNDEVTDAEVQNEGIDNGVRDEGVSIGLHEGVSVDLHEGVSVDLHEGLSDGLPEGVSDGLDVGVSDSLDEGMEGVRDGLDEGVRDGLHEGVRGGLDEEEGTCSEVDDEGLIKRRNQRWHMHSR